MDPRTIIVDSAAVEQVAGQPAIYVNGEPLRTPAGQLVAPMTVALAEALMEELLADGAADVSVPSLYALLSTQRDFIEPDPEPTVSALVELLAHDFLLHPDPRLGVRQVQIGAWSPLIDLWREVTGHDPPFAEPAEEPAISSDDMIAFHKVLHALTPAQLTVAIHATSNLKSASLGLLLAQSRIVAETALEAASATPWVLAGESQEEMERGNELEEFLAQAIDRFLRYVQLSESATPGYC